MNSRELYKICYAQIQPKVFKIGRKLEKSFFNILFEKNKTQVFENRVTTLHGTVMEIKAMLTVRMENEIRNDFDLFKSANFETQTDFYKISLKILYDIFEDDFSIIHECIEEFISCLWQDKENEFFKAGIIDNFGDYIHKTIYEV